MSASFSSPGTRSAGRALVLVLALGLFLTLAMTVWVGVTGVLAYQHLARVQSGASETIAQISQDPATAVSKLDDLAQDAAAARSLTSGPVWDLTSLFPWIGPQVAAFQTVTASADTLISESFLPLAGAAEDVTVDDLRPVDGRIDPTVLSAIVAPASAAAGPARKAAESVRDINRTPLLGVVAAAVDKADEAFSRSATLTDALARASVLLPSLLGQDGQRNYLLLVQNNAEWRSLGGISGSAILLRTHDGVVSLGDTESATALSRDTPEPIVDLPEQITSIYGTRPARYFHNLTEIPDFAVDGALARAFYAKKTGVSVDGVIAVDPVVLSYVLAATGPVNLPDGEKLTSSNAATLLMNEVYERYPDPVQQDAFFSAATGVTFQALLDGRGSAAGLLSALSRAGDEHRLLIWSAHADEQSVFAGTTIAGPLPKSDARTTRFGVYLNDGAGSKMSYFMSPQTSVAWDSCPSASGDKPRVLRLHLDLVSTAPADAGTSLPLYITGNGAYGTAPGTAKVVANIYLPEGFSLISATTTNGASFESASYDKLTVLTVGVDVAPQRSVGMDIVVRGTSTASNAEAFVTPTADPELDPVVRAPCGAEVGSSLK